MLPDEKILQSKRHRAADRPFPWRCRNCGQTRVVPHTIDYRDTVRFDDRLVSHLARDIEIPICENCGEKVFTEKVESQLWEAMQRHLHLLLPADIREGIAALGLSRKEVADRLGIAEDLLWRWAHGFSIQSRRMDNLFATVFSVARSTIGAQYAGNRVESGHDFDVERLDLIVGHTFLATTHQALATGVCVE